MIGKTEIVSVLDAYVRDGAGDAITGLQTAKGQIPSYRSSSGVTPICLLALRDPQVGSVCRKFYHDLSVRQAPVVCPWGVRLNYSRIDNPLSLYGLFVQTRYDPITGKRAREKLRPFQRKQREAAEEALTASEKTRFEDPARETLLRDFNELVKTLLAGLASEAITAVAHEIQTPAQGALGDLISLSDIPADKMPAGAAEQIERLQRNIQSTLELARRIPILIATDIEQAPGQRRMVVLHRLVETICGRLNQIAEEKHIEIRRAYNNCARSIEAVPDQLEMVLGNVIQNAVKYSFYGKPERHNTVNISYDQPDKNHLQIIVENYGTPITEQEISEGLLFVPGYRGRFSGDRGRVGTGSGLYIAKRLARSHGGDITVSSKAFRTDADVPISRNVFTIIWPITQDAPRSGTRRALR